MADFVTRDGGHGITLTFPAEGVLRCAGCGTPIRPIVRTAFASWDSTLDYLTLSEEWVAGVPMYLAYLDGPPMDAYSSPEVSLACENCKGRF